MKLIKPIDPRDQGLIQAIIGPYFDVEPTTEDILKAFEALASASKAPTSDALSDCLTIKQVADMLKVSTDTIRRRIEDGTIRAVKIGGSVRILRSEIEKLFQTPSEG